MPYPSAETEYIAVEMPYPSADVVEFHPVFPGSSDPGGALVFGKTANWSGLKISSQRFQIPRKLKLESLRTAAC